MFSGCNYLALSENENLVNIWSLSSLLNFLLQAETWEIKTTVWLMMMMQIFAKPMTVKNLACTYPAKISQSFGDISPGCLLL